jgi:abhydrolase domain-containing protein 6
MARRRRALRGLAIALVTVAVALLAVGVLAPQLALEAEFARLRWKAGAHVERARAGDHEIVYVRAGSGDPAIVFVHGYTGSKENFLALMPLLRGHALLAPDLPGWGESERRSGEDYGYAAQAERVAAWLRTLGRKVVLVGHSMGGGIAALVAARHPELIEKLVLMDAGGVKFEENEFGLAVLRGENPFGVVDRASLDRYLSTVFDDPPLVPWPADRALIAQRRVQGEFEQRVLDAIGRGPDAFLPQREAAKIVAPVLLLWCAHDRVIDASAAHLYRDLLPQSTLAMLQGCNHMPMMERPRETADLLEEFL